MRIYLQIMLCNFWNISNIYVHRNSIAQAKSDALHVNTNVRNNVLLFKYENSTYFLGLKLFSIGWICTSALLAYYSYTPQLKLIWSNDLSWIRYLQITGGRIIYFIFAVIAGNHVWIRDDSKNIDLCNYIKLIPVWILAHS